MKDLLQSVLTKATRRFAEAKEVTLPDDFDAAIEESKNPEHGDFASNVALPLAKQFRMAPRAIADGIATEIRSADADAIDAVEVAGPGFINLRVAKGAYQQQLATMLEAGRDFGRKPYSTAESVLLEFVSANPTGPLNVVNGRAASLGDSLARIFDYSGIKAAKEFYINDAGNQVYLLGESIKARLAELSGDEYEFPEGGYQGDYIIDVAKEWKAKLDTDGRTWRDLTTDELRDHGVAMMQAGQRADLNEFRCEFDRWYSEREELHETDRVWQTLAFLENRGEVYKDDGAKWLRTSNYGDEKDRIVVKSDGSATYFLADIAYHLDKLKRSEADNDMVGKVRAIDIWGPDHHGHVIRMKAAMQACGYDPERLVILIAQTVRLKEGGELKKFSKRKGEFYTLRELMEETHIDSMRYFFVSRRFDTHLDFDIDLAREISDKNPVYYIQYAHARICSIIRTAKGEAGLDAESWQPEHLKAIGNDSEKELIKTLAAFPDVVYSAADTYEPHRICYALHDLATAFHSFYAHDRVISDDKDLSRGRLALMVALRNVFRIGLDLLGLTAPEKM